MKIEECHIGQKVRYKGGMGGRIVSISEAGDIKVVERDVLGFTEQAKNLEPVSDSCQGCQKLAELQSKIEELERSRDSLIASADKFCRNATYWREELTKLQKEALADSKPLAEAAKIYLQISPEVLNMILKEREE